LLTLRAILVLGLGLSAAHADSMSPASTAGTFLNPEIGAVNGSTWTFANADNTGSLSFGETSFATFGQDFSLGRLTLTNGGQGGIGAGNHSVDLRIDILFEELDYHLSLVDAITLSIDNGSKGKKVVFAAIPTPRTFTTGGITYVVTFNGLFDAPTGGTNITSTGLQVSNPSVHDPDNDGSAYLRATVTSSVAPSVLALAPIPEAHAFGLLFTTICILGLAGFRTRRSKLAGHRRA